MAEEIVATGGLISDDIMLKVVTSRLDNVLNNKVRALLSSYPRVLIAHSLTAALDIGWAPANTGPRKAP